MLNREVINNQDEKEFVTSLIISDKCCQTLLPYVKLSYFEVDYARTVVGWVMEYFKKFKSAPKNDMSSLYKAHCLEIQDEALRELVKDYIIELSKKDITVNNEDYLVDKCKDFLDYRALSEYTDNLKACLDTRSMDKARKIQSDYKKVSTVELNECDLMDLGDANIIREALDESEEELFSLPTPISKTFGIIHRNDFISLLAPAKKGKCTARNTPIMMYDGSVKMSQNIVSGDILMGDDSTPRVVQSVSKGYGKMYRVHSKFDKNGHAEIDFTCNGDHILVLKNNSDRFKPINKYNKNGTPNGEYTKHSDLNHLKEDEVEISVNEWITLSNEQKRHLKIFRTGVEFTEKTHSLDPYFLGVWLGDGSSSCSDITNPEPEIQGYLKEYAVKMDDEIKCYSYKRCPTFRFSNTKNKWKESNIRNAISKLDLIDNKHIPSEYFIDSRKNRLRLLAGIIDTDGYAAKDCYDITLMNETLAKDIYKLCRELGFRTIYRERYKNYKGMYKETDGWQKSYQVTFTGKLSEIPLLVLRKRKEDSRKFSSLNNTWTFEIDELPEDEYYGLVIDGNHRFLLGDTTVTHNTWALQYLAIQALKARLNVVFVSMEMTRAEVVQRFWKSMFGAHSGLVKPGVYESAKFIEDSCEQGKYRSELFDINVKDNAGKDVDALQKELRTSNQYAGHLKIIAYPAFGASVQDITNRVEELADEGFVTDVLIIDYSDITKPIGGGTEIRNQLDATWKHLRGFSMKFHCATITASQTNRSGFGSSIIGAETISEDIRKICHVTSMVSLEQTSKMKKNHIMRLRNIALRNGESSDNPCVFCQCLPLGQFVFGEPILSDDLIMNDEDEEDDTN